MVEQVPSSSIHFSQHCLAQKVSGFDRGEEPMLDRLFDSGGHTAVFILKVRINGSEYMPIH